MSAKKNMKLRWKQAEALSVKQKMRPASAGLTFRRIKKATRFEAGEGKMKTISVRNQLDWKTVFG